MISFVPFLRNQPFSHPPKNALLPSQNLACALVAQRGLLEPIKVINPFRWQLLKSLISFVDTSCFHNSSGETDPLNFSVLKQKSSVHEVKTLPLLSHQVSLQSMNSFNNGLAKSKRYTSIPGWCAFLPTGRIAVVLRLCTQGHSLEGPQNIQQAAKMKL